MNVHIDFETRSAKSIKHGAYAYSMAPSTEVLCICYAIDDGPVKLIKKDEPLGELLALLRNDKVIFVAHNAAFEYLIFKNVLKLEIPLDRWRCTAAMCAIHGLPRALGEAAKALKLSHLKDEEGKRIMMKMCKPVTERHRHLHGYWHEDPKDFEVLHSYCVDDVETERALEEVLPMISDEEQKVWELDQKINLRGLPVDVELCEAALDMRKHIDDALTEEFFELCALTPNQNKLVREFLGVDSLAKDKLPKLIENAESKTHKRMLEIRQEFAASSLAKYATALDWQVGGRVKGSLLYHGAKTGRWTGKGVQFQNVPQGFIKNGPDMDLLCEVIKAKDYEMLEGFFPESENTLDCLRSALRGMVKAPEGQELAALDYSQIEPRVLAWLASDEDLLNVFRRGDDVYVHTANKMGKDTPRVVGKLAVLSLGYQTGPKTLRMRAAQMGVTLSLDECKEIVSVWRETNGCITSLWYECDRLAKKVVRTGVQQTTVNGMLTFRMNGRFLQMVLPNGRTLNYYKPGVGKFIVQNEGDEFEVENVYYWGADSQMNVRWGKIAMRGAMFVQNATQAVSRDLLVNSMYEFEKEGIETINTVHDEVLALFEKSKFSLPQLLAIMDRKPEWAKDIPVASDGFISNRYRK